MISRSGGRVTRGDGAEVTRGTVGTDAPGAGIGAARVLVGMYSLLLTVTLLVFVLVRWQADGVLVLATLSGLVFAWAGGAFTKSFWSR